MARPSSRARASLEKSFSATSLGNWEIPSEWGMSARGPASVSGSTRRSHSRASSRRSSASRRSRSIRTVTNANGHLLPHLKKPNSSFMPSQDTLYMNWREKERLRTAEMKQVRKIVRKSMSTQEIGAEMAAAAQRSRPMSASHGRPNRDRARPATPDSIFGDAAIVGDAPARRPATASASAGMSKGEAEDVISAKDSAVWIGSVPDSVDEEQLTEIMSMFGEVAAVNLRTKNGNKSWGFVLFKEPVVAKKVKSYGIISHEEYTMTVKDPDLKNLSNADMRSMAHVWRETLKKTSEGKHIDDFRRHIEGSVPGGANSMLRLFKEFRRKASSDDNDIDVAEFRRALKSCSIYMTDNEVKRLHAAMDTNGNGQIDIDEFAAFVIGRYDALGAASNNGASIGSIGDHSHDGKGDGKGWKYQPKSPGGQKGPATTSAVDTSIWVGNIPENLCDEQILETAVVKAYGPVDSISIRRKGDGKASWAMVVMQNQDDVTKAIIAGKLPVLDPEYGQMTDLLLQPVALKKELGDSSGSLADVWRKTVSKTSHGKNLDLFRRKIEAKIEGGPNSVLKLFKQFRETAGAATNRITMDEFKFCVNKLNLGMTPSQAEALFLDIDLNNNGHIDLNEFELAILGRVGDLG